MFSGIVQSLQPITQLDHRHGHLWVTIKKPARWKTKVGDSINVDGVCSTIASQTPGYFSFEYMPETLRLTTLKKIKLGQLVNLETALTLNSLIGGHLVAGHIDSIGKVGAIKLDHKSKIISLNYPKQFNKYVISKGSLAVNGVSLTIFNNFQVALIQHTLQHTNLGLLKKNDAVNLEFDLIGKYVERQTKV